MSRSRSIQISIPQPCSQRWDEMTPGGNGRFCDHCQKTVIDFSAWSDKELYHFFSGAHGPVCGKVFNDQMNRAITAPPQPHSRLYRITVAMGLTFLIAGPPHTQAQTAAPLTALHDTVAKNLTPRSKDSTSLSGTVIDENKEPVINAAIQVYQNGILKGGQITDFDGNYLITHLNAGDYEVIVFYFGYDTVKKNVTINNNTATKLDFALLKPRSTEFHCGAVRTAYKTPLTSHYDQSKTTITREQIDRIIH